MHIKAGIVIKVAEISELWANPKIPPCLFRYSYTWFSMYHSINMFNPSLILECSTSPLHNSEALFDIRVIDANAHSYVLWPVASILYLQLTIKINENIVNAYEQCPSSFTPLIMSVDGMNAPQTNNCLTT